MAPRSNSCSIVAHALVRAASRLVSTPPPSTDVASTRLSTRHARVRAPHALHLRPDHLKPIPRPGIFIATHASDRAQLVRIDAEILDNRVVHVEPHDLAHDQAAAVR